VGVPTAQGEDVVSPASCDRMTTPVEKAPSSSDERFGLRHRHPELELEPVTFRSEEGAVTSAFWGSRWLRPSRTPERPRFDPPAGWYVLTGRYISWDP
jgi:hypothetical protein